MIDLLRGHWKVLMSQFGHRLMPLEEALLRILHDQLGPPATDVLNKQIQLVNHVQRFIGGSRDVDLYRLRHGKSDYSEMPLFPNHRESKLATIKYRTGKGLQSNRMDFWLVKGHLFSLTYGKRPPWREMSESKPIAEKIVIHVDPMVPAEPPLRNAVQLAEPVQPLEGILVELDLHATIGAFFAPLPPAERHQRLSQFDTVFPVDYLELLAQTDGLLMEGATIYGAYDIHQVNLNEGDFLVIGDIVAPAEDDGALCVSTGTTAPSLYFFTYSSCPPAFLGNSLYEALDKLSLLRQRT
jgi:hypothetical protein